MSTAEDLQENYEWVLLGLVGSRAYGLDTPDSDSDYLGCFQIETQALLGLDKPIETITNTDPDYTGHDLGKFCRLALAGNPTVLELLWLPGYLAQNEVGVTLVGLRDSFLSNRVRDSFGGYARAQLGRLQRNGKGDSRGSKYIRHLFRLLREGSQLLTTGTLTVKVADPEELFALGLLDVEAVIDRFEKEYDAFRKLPSVLPEQPDKVLINGFLTETRLKALPPDLMMEEKLENAKDAIRTLRRMVGVPGQGFR